MAHVWIPVPFLVVALMTDLRHRKIYNWTTYPLLLTGMMLQWHMNGWGAFVTVSAALMLYLFLSSLYKSMKPGGGDVKLLLGCMLFLNLSGTGVFVLLLFLISALLAMGQYGRLYGSRALVQTLKLDMMTGGTAPKEAVHVLGALVILLAYGGAVAARVCKWL